MKAMILAAGLGTRLKPLTLNKPKALVPVGNRSVIDRVIDYLKQYGINEIILNAHHHHQQLVEHLDHSETFGMKIQVRVEPEILGTGGGIRNTEDFWDADPFIVINSDILTNIDILAAYEAHKRYGALVTLVLHDQPPFNQIQIDSQMNIVHIAEDNRSGRLAFTGIHIIEPELLGYIPKGVFSSIIDCYRQLIETGNPIKAHRSRGHYWRDVGSIETYVLANREALEGDSFLFGSGSQIPSSAKLGEWAIIGENAYLEENVEIRRSILWENVTVRARKKVVDSIVTASKEVTCDLIDKII
jgi:mannose-1-phosphate guanylyltransferase